MVVTPQSGKKFNKKGGTPQSAKQTGTPKSQKQSLPPTPESKSKAKPETTPQHKNQSQQGTPNSQKVGKPKTPQSHEVKFKTPQLEKNSTPAATGKVQKPDTPYPHGSMSGKKGQQASPKVTTPNLMSSEKQAANKKRKISDDEDSAEDDFEALLGKGKKLKVEASTKKTKVSSSPSATAGTNKQITPSKQNQVVTKKSPAQLKQTPVVGKKRQLDSEEDDDEDDDEAEDDDEDDSDEDEVQKASKKQKLTVTPVATVNVIGNGSEETAAIQLSAAEITKDLRLKEERDRRTLFIKKLPADVSETQVKALHSGILRVRFGESRWQKKSKKSSRFAHIEFKDEKAAEEALKGLTGKKVGEIEVVVDYVGAKSKNIPKGNSKVIDLSQLDPCKLFVSCYPLNTTAVDLKAVFPGASNIEFLVRRLTSQPLGYAFVHYKSSAECKKGHDTAQGKSVRGQPILVQYAKKSSKKQTNKGVAKVGEKQVSAAASIQQGKAKSAVAPQKKQTATESEEDDEDDDDDDESEEDDDDDDDEEEDDESEDDDEDDDDDDDDDEEDDDE